MQLAFWKKVAVASLAVSLVLADMAWSPTIGQDAKKTADKGKAGAREKAKGRLPAYYKDVVTEEQRTQIYAIQAKYKAQLDALQSQIDAVEAKQNAEIDGLLSAEQKEKLQKVKDDAEAKRKERAAAKDKTDGDANKSGGTPKTTTTPEKKKP